MRLIELAMKAGNLKPQADAWAENLKTHLSNAKKIGDIEKFEVRQKEHLISAWDDDRLIAVLRTDVIPNAYTVVDDLWVDQDYRGQKVMSKLLWFLKSRLGYKKLLLGKFHSTDTFELLKNDGFSKFKKSWFDPMTWQMEPFDSKTIDDYYTLEKSKWSLMLEAPNDALENLPRFNEGAGFIAQSYDWQIE